jgi:hypothetical protein
MATADAIITTLAGHAAEAEAMAAGAREDAGDARETERQANAARAQAEADELPDQAAACARRAAAAAEDAEACEAWAVAASDASAYGVGLTVREDAVHAPVGHAIAAAGGRAWIADDKHFLSGGA